MIGHRLEVANKKAKRRAGLMDSQTNYPYVSEHWYLYRKVTKRCSCWMCGHQRENLGPTIQELRQQEVLNAEQF